MSSVFLPYQIKNSLSLLLYLKYYKINMYYKINIKLTCIIKTNEKSAEKFRLNFVIKATPNKL